MPDIKEQKKEDNLALSFHNWRKNDAISKLFFSSLENRLYNAFRDLKNLYQLPYTPEDKLMKLGELSACIDLMQSIIDVNYEDMKDWMKEANNENN